MAKTRTFEALDGEGQVYITRYAGPAGAFRIQIEAVPSGTSRVLTFGVLETKGMSDFLACILDKRDGVIG